VFTELVEAHARFLSLAALSVHRCFAEGRGPPRVSFQPGVNPLWLQANRSAASYTCVVNLPPFAGGVDRVPTHAGVFRRLCNVQPRLHSNLLGNIGRQQMLALTR
jgi:hypothetical protein